MDLEQIIKPIQALDDLFQVHASPQRINSFKDYTIRVFGLEQIGKSTQNIQHH